MQTLSSPRKPVHTKCMGIEIECLVPRHIEDMKYYGFFYAGYDGSIRGWSRCKGIEFVSQPLPYEWLRKETLRLSKKIPWEYNATCGIHVHVSRTWCSEKRIQRLCEALRRFRREDMEMLFGRVSRDYADPLLAGISRYGAINTQNTHTIEFRMWAPGDAQWAIECLRRTKLMVEHRGKFTPDSLMELFTNPEK